MSLKNVVRDTTPKLSIAFTSADLMANRRGMMTPQQKRRLVIRRCLVMPLQLLALFTVLVLVIGIGASLFYGVGALGSIFIGPIGTQGIPLYLWGFILVVAAPLTLCVAMFILTLPDLIRGEVKSSNGRLMLAQTDQQTLAKVIAVGNYQAQISSALFNTLHFGESYEIFYAKFTGTMLSIGDLTSAE